MHHHHMQMQGFPTTSDAYPPRCVGVGGIANLGLGGTNVPVPVAATKHYKVHGGNATFGNFTNYIHSSDPDSRGMTRIVFNGNNTRSEFHCGPENFQSCLANEIIDNTGAYQLNFVNPGANVRFIRQQMHPSFPGENQMQMQRCYIQRPQGQQGRFVRVQGSKMRPNVPYRAFNNNNQRQKQNRRFTAKGFNSHYKNQKSSTITNSDGLFEDNGPSSPNRCVQSQQEFPNTPEKDSTRKSPQRPIIKQEGQKFKSKASRSRNCSTLDFGSRLNKADGTKSNLVEPKVEFVGNPNDLSYDDVSENSDDNNDNDGDLRERLIRKKHHQFIKREPGELESDEDDVDVDTWPENNGASNKRKLKNKSTDDEISKKLKKSASSYDDYGSKDSKRSKKSGRKFSNRNSAKENNCSSYNRCSSNEDNLKSVAETPKHTLQCPNTGSSYAHYYCCPDQVDVADLKKLLRETQDKLLEANVMGTKKSVKMQEEIIQLKRQLDETSKNEKDLKLTLKNVENELSAKNSELGKITLLHEVEKQEKMKLRSELSHSFKERLAIEVEKLRALFDVEVAKMQAYYFSNIYDDNASNTLADIIPTGEAQNQNGHTPRHDIQMVGEIGNEETENINPSPRSSNCEIPFVQTYFNIPTQASTSMAGLTHSSFLENVMAYNSLIQQHVYAQTSATSSSVCAEGSGNCNATQ